MQRGGREGVVAREREGKVEGEKARRGKARMGRSGWHKVPTSLLSVRPSIIGSRARARAKPIARPESISKTPIATIASEPSTTTTAKAVEVQGLTSKSISIEVLSLGDES